jgi:hypothetical protein
MTRDSLPTYRYMKQIARNEVRLKGFRILTIPVRGVVWTDAGYKPVKRAWRSLLRQLKAKRDAKIAERLARKPNPNYAKLREALTERKGMPSQKERLAAWQHVYPEPSIPKVYDVKSHSFNRIKCRPTICRVCGEQFYLGYRAHSGWYADPLGSNYSEGSHYCSEACLTKPYNAKRNERRQKKAARHRKELASRTCEVCNQPLEPRRSTRRYCSTKCRVAAMRKRNAKVDP